MCNSVSYLFQFFFAFTVFCYPIVIKWLLIWRIVSPLEAIVILAYDFCSSELDIETKLFIVKDPKYM